MPPSPCPPGTLKTAYRIGKGFMTDEEVAVWEKLGHPEVAEVAAKSPAPETAAAAGAAVGAPAADADAPVAIAAEPADQPEVHALLRQSDAYHATLYPAESNHLLDVAALSEPNVRFVVARRGGVAVGCGGLVLGADGEAELKRMFVTPEARGRKHRQPASSRRWKPPPRPKACASSASRPACASPSCSPSTAATATRSAGRSGRTSATR